MADESVFLAALRQAVDAGFEKPDIAKGFQKAGVQRRYYDKEIASRKTQIKRSVGPTLERLESLERQLQSAEEKEHRLREKEPTEPQRFLAELLEAFSIIGSLFIGVAFFAGIVIGLYRLFVGSWPEWIGKTWELLISYTGLVSIGTLSSLVLLGMTIRNLYLRSRWRNWRKENLGTIEKLGIEGLKQNRDAARLDLASDLADSAESELRDLVGRFGQPSYSNVLGDLKAPGLSEVYDVHYKIDTDTMKRLQERLEQMPGGSIGIAGPRGSGKTTLIASFCDAGSWELKDRPVLSEMTSAPVDYDARDFILHVFARLCRRVLSLRGGDDVATDEAYGASKSSTERVARSLLHAMARLRLTFTILAANLIFFGLLLGVAQFHVTRTQTETGESGDGLGAIFDLLAGLSEAFGLQPLTVLFFGLAALAIPYVVRWIAASSLPVGTLSVKFGEAWDDQEGRFDRAPKETDDASSAIKDELIELARKHDHTIKFQQTFTSGWSGGLKLPPLGLEGGVNRSVTLVQRPLSLPEIVARYREFAKHLTDEYELIIGIDELDKMQSDDKARRFLNDIKVLFGIDCCFYLLSVSESAMSSFERRGLPFRDEFDSAFDEVLRVQYLDFERAKELIKRRVVGMPMSFIALGYCMSGGLARDMIRFCREIIAGPKREKTELAIDDSCERIVTSELRSKLCAIKVSLKKIRLEDETALFLEKLRQIEMGEVTSSTLFDYGQTIFTSAARGTGPSKRAPGGTPTGGEAEEILKDRHTLRRLREELATYLLYCSTVRGLFVPELDKIRFSHLEQDKTLDRIAGARQSFAVNLRHSRSILEEVRAKNAITPPNFSERSDAMEPRDTPS